MEDLSNRVVACKTALMNALGVNAARYLANLKMWFRHKWTKEKFDYESRKLLTPDKMHLHNQFFVAILLKIDALQAPPLATPLSKQHANGSVPLTSSSSSRSHKRKRSRTCVDRATFEPFDVLDFIADDNMDFVRAPPTMETTVVAAANSQQVQNMQRYCARELFLPDTGFMLGRFLVGAWEVDLVSVDDNVAQYMVMAVQVFLKNLISAIIMKRRHYRVTGEGSFYYDVGAALKDPSLRNTVTRQKVDDAPLELDKEITSPNFVRRPTDEGTFLSACEEVYPQEDNLITLRHVQRAFVDRNLIASHTLYAINMERLTQMMH